MVFHTLSHGPVMGRKQAGSPAMSRLAAAAGMAVPCIEHFSDPLLRLASCHNNIQPLSCPSFTAAFLFNFCHGRSCSSTIPTTQHRRQVRLQVPTSGALIQHAQIG